MTTVTSLPALAALIKAATMGESAPVRYKVCLIANTSGATAAWRINSTTGEKASNG